MSGATPHRPVSYLAHQAATRPESPALFDSGQVISFRRLMEAVTAAAARLRERRVRPGDVVGLRLPNIWEYAALELAVPLIGAINLPLPPALGRAELAWATGRTGAALVVEDQAEAASLCAPGGPRASPEDEPPAEPRRIVEIALTSGTTGLPKLASLSAGLKQATFEGFTTRLGIVPGDRVLPMSPLSQGIGGMCLYCLRSGASLVMLREPRFTAEHTLSTASASGATFLVGVPTNVIRMLASPGLGRIGPGAARATAVAGAPMPPEAARRWEEATGSRVCSFYGSMDAGQLAVGSPADPAGKRWQTVGRPHDCLQVAIVEGEICARGPTIQERYWGEDHGPYAADGWAHMGDLGRLDAEGYLHVEGRLKDLIIRGGSNVNPHEVENAIRSLPPVRDVCVVGRPDADLGERAVAFVAGSEPVTLADLTAHLDRLGLAHYKWPESLVLLDELPLSGPGKVDRRALRERAAGLSG